MRVLQDNPFKVPSGALIFCHFFVTLHLQIRLIWYNRQLLLNMVEVRRNDIMKS